MRRALAALLAAAAALAPGPAGADDSEAGRYDLALSTLLFEAPLFGTRSFGTYRLFASQWLGERGALTGWYRSGFPHQVEDFGVELERVPYRGGEARLNAGDLFLGSLYPEGFVPLLADGYTLRGLAAGYRRGAGEVRVAVGEAKFFLPLPGRPSTKPNLASAGYLHRFGASHLGLSLTAIEDATFLDQRTAPGLTGVLEAGFFHRLTPGAHLFSDLYAGAEGGFAGRLGAQLNRQLWNLTAQLYSFGGELPYVYPLFRPGERGAELSVRYELSEVATLFGRIDYVADREVRERSQLRGELGWAMSFGSGKPLVQVRYGRDELAFDSETIAAPDATADRLAVLVSQALAAGYTDLALEHVFGSGSQRDRTQGVLTYRRQLPHDLSIEGGAVAQREEGGSVGFTWDSAVEVPLGSGRWRILSGLGGAWVRRSGRESGEGLVRLGTARRLRGSGWTGRLEVGVPFSVGLPRSSLSRRQVSLSLRNRFAWPDLPTLRSRFDSLVRPRRYGAVEGSLRLDGEGLGGVKILIDGEPRAVTAADGSFRVGRLPAGAATVGVDLRSLDPRYSLEGDVAREVAVTPAGVARVDFRAAELRYFQGAVVRCQAGGLEPVAGVVLDLRGEGASYRATSGGLGGFQLDGVTPGIYVLEVDPASLPPELAAEEPAAARIDLHRDLTGFLLRLGCPELPEGSPPRPPG